MLQKFVESKTSKNSMIHLHNQLIGVFRILWSPKICLFERRENLRELHDRKLSMYERVVTFEGEEFHSRLCTLPSN
jgi:hypothetical protein